MLNNNYIIFKDHKLVITCHTGTFNFESFKKFRDIIFADPDFSQELNQFVHLKNVNFDISEEDLKKMVEIVNNNSNLNRNKRIALVTHTPNQVVSTTMYKLLWKGILSVEIFSTNKAALKWLNVTGLSHQKVEAILKKFVY